MAKDTENKVNIMEASNTTNMSMCQIEEEKANITAGRREKGLKAKEK